VGVGEGVVVDDAIEGTNVAVRVLVDVSVAVEIITLP